MKQKPTWKQPIKRIRSNCGGCQRRHEAMQQTKRAMLDALQKVARR